MAQTHPLHCPVVSLSSLRSKGKSHFCQHCSLPILLLDATGKALEMNDAFELIWEVDSDKVLHDPGYNLFADPCLQSREIQGQIGNAFRGNPIRLELDGYSFPAQFRIAGHREKELLPTTIGLVPTMEKGSVETIHLFYYNEMQVRNVKSMERKFGHLAAYLNSIIDLKHEINNPLLLIIGNAQLLLSKSGEMPTEMTQKLEKIVNSAEKIRKILEQHERTNAPLYHNPVLDLMEE